MANHTLGRLTLETKQRVVSFDALHPTFLLFAEAPGRTLRCERLCGDSHVDTLTQTSQSNPVRLRTQSVVAVVEVG